MKILTKLSSNFYPVDSGKGVLHNETGTGTRFTNTVFFHNHFWDQYSDNRLMHSNGNKYGQVKLEFTQLTQYLDDVVFNGHLEDTLGHWDGVSARRLNSSYFKMIIKFKMRITF